MSSSFTTYAQNFISHVVIPQKHSQTGQNLNFYVNNSNVAIQNHETYNINNNILVINKFSNTPRVEVDEIAAKVQEHAQVIQHSRKCELSGKMNINYNSANSSDSSNVHSISMSINCNNSQANFNSHASHTSQADVSKNNFRSSKFNENHIAEKEFFLESISNKGRHDVRGVPIIKGSKKHKVTFIDKINGGKSNKLVQRVEIQSYKELNACNTFGEGDLKKPAHSASCCIII